ncbi:hypothetical protein EG328_003363 [Venturia inaequalis]|uniref:Uncharacterized protein n=1 Tax=Venturia inaequalis TaxID=5025 RepID=A0A8H3VEF8_VENIN|nr:hypothetical protein EG328_003363 [Venturia inaequalis]
MFILFYTSRSYTNTFTLTQTPLLHIPSTEPTRPISLLATAQADRADALRKFQEFSDLATELRIIGPLTAVRLDGLAHKQALLVFIIDLAIIATSNTASSSESETPRDNPTAASMGGSLIPESHIVNKFPIVFQAIFKCGPDDTVNRQMARALAERHSATEVLSLEYSEVDALLQVMGVQPL